MKVVLLLAEHDPSAWDRATDAERDRVLAQHTAFDQAVRQRGALVAGEALAASDTARTLRTGPDRPVTLGPYAETTEQMTGFYVIDVPSTDDALELAGLLPEGYTIEVRPVVEIEGYDAPG